MKLHLDTKETTTGLIFKKKAWDTTFRIEFSPEEKAIIDKHPEVLKLPLASAMFGSTEVNYSVGMVSRPTGAGGVMESIAAQTQLEADVRDGCAKLKSHLGRLAEIAGGPTTVEF